MAQSQYGGRSDLSGNATDLKDQATDQITNPTRKYSTDHANQSMPYAWRPDGIFADLILRRKQSCVVLP